MADKSGVSPTEQVAPSTMWAPPVVNMESPEAPTVLVKVLYVCAFYNEGLDFMFRSTAVDICHTHFLWLRVESSLSGRVGSAGQGEIRSRGRNGFVARPATTTTGVAGRF